MADLEAIRRAAETTPPAELPELIGALAAAQAIATRRLIAPEPTPTTPDARAELLNAAEMASRLAIKPSWLLEMSRQGRVPHTRVGRFVRFDPDAVLAWAKSHTSGECNGR